MGPPRATRIVSSVDGAAASDPDGGVQSAHGAARRRVLVSFGAGLAAFAVSLLATPWQTAALIGWNVAATVFIVWVWLIVRGMDGEATARHAVIEDLTRGTADLVLILASGISRIGVGLSLLEASDTGGVTKALLGGVASGSPSLPSSSPGRPSTWSSRCATRGSTTPPEAGSTSTTTATPRLPGLRVPRVHDRDDIPGFGYVNRVEDGPPNCPAPRVHVVPLRHRRRRDDDQRRGGTV